MCGFVCIYSPDRTVFDPTVLRRMTDAIQHRGPDDYGYAIVGPEVHVAWREREPDMVVTSGVAMGHRRLSILDLSAAGRQPFCSRDHRYSMVYNGEVYNYVELRDELCSLGYSFRSSTDTEVVLAAYAEWGAGCLQRFNGMWALVIWDMLARTLFAARDRFGIKPLYYLQTDDRWLFASEVKALLNHPGVKPEPDMGMVLRFLWSEDAPEGGDTFFQGIRSLPAAHFVELQSGEWRQNRYWALPEPAASPALTLDERSQELRELLTDSVRLELRSDVPVGTMLSGGLDSTSIASAINTNLKSEGVDRDGLGGRQRAISACYPGRWNDETAKIDELAEHLSIDVDKVYPAEVDVSARFVDVVAAVEQPFAGTMPVVQDLMMRKAQSIGLSVTLNGHGPDEMFAGYPARHCSFVAAQYLRRGRLGRSVQEVVGMKKLYQVGMTDFIYTLLRVQFPPAARWLRQAVRLSDRRYFRKEALREHALSPARFLDDQISGTTALDRRLKREFFFEVVPRYLTYEDGVSMASSVEARVPFLDHRIVEFSFSLGDADKINHGVSKFILRNAMKDVLPNAIVEDHRKIYIESPFRNWLQGCLRRTVTGGLLGDDTLISELMDPDEFRPLILRVLDGAKCSGWELSLVWRMLTAEVWLRRFMEGSAGLPASATHG